MKKTLLGLAVASALSSTAAYAVVGTNFDETGTSSAGVVVSQFVWNVDNALLYQGTGTSSGQAFLLAVGRLDTASGAGGVVVPDAGNAFTYELSIPVNVTDTTTALKLTFDATRTASSFFKMYHTTGAVNQAAGTGYGAQSGCVGCTEILSGTPNFVGGFMTLTYGLDDFGNHNRLKIGDPIGNTIPTLVFEGARTINIELDSQDSAYFRSGLEVVGFDMNLLSQAFNAPFPASPLAPFVAASVMGHVPNLGAPGSTPVGDPDSGSITGTLSSPINNQLCDGGGGADGSVLTPTDCDVRLNTGQGNLQILAETTLPEPGSIALTGLGLGLVGVGIRRRRNKAK
jgi:hypothetical protein